MIQVSSDVTDVAKNLAAALGLDKGQIARYKVDITDLEDWLDSNDWWYDDLVRYVEALPKDESLDA